MNYIPEETSIVFQELPGEVSLTFSITGCGRGCKLCHSPHLQSSKNGEELTADKVLRLIEKNRDFITNVIFFGGEWEENTLIYLLKIVKEYNLKSTLFTAENSVSEEILARLDYLKTGEYIDSLGGLSSKKTNQKMINVKTGEDITYKYHSVLDSKEN